MADDRPGEGQQPAATPVEERGAGDERIERALGEYARMLSTLSRAVTTVSADLGGRLDVIRGQLERRLPVGASDVDAVRRVVAEEAASLAETVREELDSFREQVRREQESLLRRLDQLGTGVPGPGLEGPILDLEPVQAAVQIALTDLAQEVRRDVELLVAESHEDRAVLARRLAREPVLDPETLVERLTAGVAGAMADSVASAMAEAVGAAVERRVADVVQAVAEQGEAVARRLEDLESRVGETPRPPDGEAELDALRRDLAAELDAVESEFRTIATGIRTDTQGLVGEIHDDLALMMRQLVGGQQAVEELARTLREDGGAAPADAGEMRRAVEDLGAAMAEQLGAAVGEVGEDLALVSRRLVAVHEQLDEVRQAVAEGQAPPVDLGPIGEDLRALRRAVVESAPQVELAPLAEELHAELATVRDHLGAQLQQLIAAVDEMAAGAGLVDHSGPDLPALLGVLREETSRDLAGLAAYLRDELDQLRQEVAAGPPAEAQVDLGPLAAEVHDDLGSLAAYVRDEFDQVRQELAAGRDEVAALAAPVEETGAGMAELRGELERVRALLRRLRDQQPAPDPATLATEVAAAVAPEVAAEVAAVVGPELAAGTDAARAALEALIMDLHDGLAAVVTQLSAGQDQLARLEDVVASTPVGAAPDDVSAAVSEAVAEVVEAGVAPAVARELRAALGGLRDDLAGVRNEVAALLAAAAEDMASELRVDLKTLVARQAEVVPQVAGAAESVVAALHAEVVDLIAGLQDDVGVVARQAAAGHDEVRRLRDEVAITLAELGEGGADPAVAIESVRADLGAEVAALAADVRADVEALVRELHDDLAVLARQIAALDAKVEDLRAEVGTATGPPAEQMAGDLDRLTRDLQALRERLAVAPPPQPRRPRPRP